MSAKRAIVATIAFALFSELVCGSVSAEAVPQAAPLVLEMPVRDKNFYLLTLLDAPAPSAVLGSDPALSRMTRDLRARIAQAEASCGRNAACYVKAARLTDGEVTAAAEALRRLHRTDAAIRNVVRDLRLSGVMIKYHALSDVDLLVTAWKGYADVMSRTLSVYGEGLTQGIYSIDTMAHDPKSERFAELVRTATQIVTGGKPALFYSDARRFALLLMAIDGRDEASAFEPIDKGENKLARERIPRTTWQDYPYTVIIVPGEGLDNLVMRLAAGGRLRLELAVERYRRGDAPFILVSGGNVHPTRTPYYEAIEMKRALMEQYKVPPDAILVDPHARHTTTNLRNAARLMYRYGMPFESPALIVTDESQADYIMSQELDERNLREIGILPYHGKKRLSRFDIEIQPNVAALQTGWQDPLDP